MATDLPPSISVCIAAYNEQELIADTLTCCAGVLEEIPGDHEILVVDDGSTDETGRILKEMTHTFPILRPLTHPENRGLAHAQRWLIQEARGDLICHFPADGEVSVTELPKLLAKMEEGYDVVIGVRQQKQYTPYRQIVSWLYNLCVLLLFWKRFRDIGGARLARASIWKQGVAESNTATFIAEKLILASQLGARFGYVPVKHGWRSQGTSKFNNPWRAVQAFRELITFRLSPRSWRKPKREFHQTSSHPGSSERPEPTPQPEGK